MKYGDDAKYRIANDSKISDVRGYSQAGVDIERGDHFVEFIRTLQSPAVQRGIGGFSGVTELNLASYREPVLLTTCDGVGTKLLVAKRLGRYDTIGIDLVAMCVNDLVVCGAHPILFQDYIACGRIDEGILRSVMAGIVRGCELSGCKLTGGETAELPDMYEEDAFDLAGFSAGIVEKDALLPRIKEIRAGHVVLGLPSTGIHSNGLSLARKIFEDEADWQRMLSPTKIYAAEMKVLLESRLVLAAAHITGGGIEANIRRVIPPELDLHIGFYWPRPDIFTRIQERGGISEAEMRRVFNLGIGIALIVSPDSESQCLRLCEKEKIRILRIGHIESRR